MNVTPNNLTSPEASNFFQNLSTKVEKRLAAIPLAVVIALGATACATNTEAGGPKPSTTTSSEATPTPSESETATPSPEGQYTVEELEISAGLDAETLGKLLIEDRFTKWLNAGATDELLKRSINENISWSDLLPKVAEENAEIFSKSLFIDGWESTKLSDHEESLQSVNLIILDNYIQTAWSGDENPKNIEGYRTWMTVDTTTETLDEGGSRTLKLDVTNYANNDKNVGPAPSSEKAIWIITLQEVDGQEKITAIDALTVK